MTARFKPSNFTCNGITSLKLNPVKMFMPKT